MKNLSFEDISIGPLDEFTELYAKIGFTISENLSFEDIISIDTLDQLTELYAKRGFTISEKEMLPRLKQDWKRCRDEYFYHIHLKPDLIPNQVPSLDVLVDGVDYRIYGVVHAKNWSAEYNAIVSKTIENGKNWLHEQKMHTVFDLPKNSIEIPDHHLLTPTGYLRIFTDSMVNGFTSPISIPLNKNKKYSKFKEKMMLSSLDMPFEAYHRPLPSYVKIQLNEKNKPAKYTPIQARSAYQAEFMKAWKVEGDKHILVGAMHAPEIKYFLKYGVKDVSITDAAQEHALLSTEDPEKFAWLNKKSSLKTTLCATAGYFGGLTASSATLGYSVYSWVF